MPVQELFAILVVSILLAPAMAAAGEYQDVPCEKLHFRIEGEGIYAQCQMRHEVKGSWGATSEVIYAEELWGFTLIQKTVTDHRSLMYKENARNVVAKLNSPEIRDWSEAVRLAGYRVHRFRAPTKLGSDSTCFYFERYEQARSGGFKRRMVGISCSSDPDPIDDATAAAMLDRIVLQ